MRAIFLDRDGTINREVNYLSDIKKLRILPGAATAIKQLNRLGFAVIVVTNQGAIAHGLITEKELDRLHAVMVRRLGRSGAVLDGIYYCPHHPKAKLKKYRVICACRKPNLGMIRKAAKEHGIRMKGSFMVGDLTADIVLGKRAGLATILVQTGYAGKDERYKAKPDFIAKDLMAAVRIIKKHGK